MGIRWEPAGTSSWLKAGLLGLACLTAAAQNISTFAGNGIAQFSGDGGPAASASLYDPTGVALDAAGNLYIADLVNNRVRKVSAGIITTVAGNRNQGFSGDGGPAASASLFYPSAVAVDAAGNLYIADKYNNRIRKVSGGIITTIAGNGTAGYSGDGGPATSASLYSPSGVAVDLGGNLYIADLMNSRIRKVSGGFIATVAGNGNFGFSGDGGPATSASLFDPSAVAVDAAGNLYIADSGNSRIRKVSGGFIATVAGGGTSGFSGDGGPATSASLGVPEGVAVDPVGNLYISDEGNHRIRKVSGGIMTTVAGNGNQGFSGDGGPATSASFNQPFGVAVDSAGNLYIADTNNNRIREVSALGNTTPAITSVTTAYGGPVIAQNDFIVIKGANLVPANTLSSGVTWSTAPSFASGLMPTQLGGVSVTVNSKPAFVYFYCSAATDPSCPQDQLNILTPLDNTTGSVPVVVTSGGVSSPPFTATMQAVAPAFLLFSTAGYIAATHANGALVGPTTLYPGSSTPASPGETIALYAVGFGLPATPLVNGSAIQSGSLPVLPVCQVGTATAALGFAGLTGPGLYQLNLMIPATAANGDRAVSCIYNGSTTPAGALITVQSGTTNPTTTTLTITTSGTGSGTVTSSPTGTSCGSACLTFPTGTVVTLTATAAAGSTFAGWSGPCSGTGGCIVTMNANQAVTATFNLIANPTLTISISPATATVQTGGTQQLTAPVTGGASAILWSVNGISGGNATIGTINGAGLYTAPAFVPASNPQTIAATAAVDITKTASALVTVASPGTPLTLSESSGAPGDTLVATASGFDPSATTWVIFRDPAGNETRVQSSYVDTSTASVAVPPFLNVAQSRITAGVVSVLVLQQTQASATVFGPVPLSISDLPQPGLPTGTVTLFVLDQLQTMLSATAQSWQAIGLASSGSIDTSSMQTDLLSLQSQLVSMETQVQSLVNGTVSAINLGLLSQEPVTLDINSLAVLDGLFTAYLANPSNQPAGASPAIRALAGRAQASGPCSPDPRPCIANLINPSVSTGQTTQSIANQFETVQSAALTIVAVVGVGAAVAGAPAFAVALTFTAAIAPGVIGVCALYASSPFFTQTGTAPTLADYQPFLEVLKKGSQDFLKQVILEKSLGELPAEFLGALQGISGMLDPDNSQSLTFQSYGNSRVFANMPHTVYTMTLITQGNGSVKPSIAGLPVNCGSGCLKYVVGLMVKLTPMPNAGATFIGWSVSPAFAGSCPGTGTCTVTMNSNVTVTAMFSPPAQQYTLTTITSGAGGGTISVSSSPSSLACGPNCLSFGAGGVAMSTAAASSGSTFTFGAGSVVMLTANANSGSNFTGWSVSPASAGSCPGMGTCTVTMNSNVTVTATFSLAPPIEYTLTMTTSGTGSGTVSASSSSSSLYCGANCLSFGAGSVVMLTATASSGSTFTGWSVSPASAGSCPGVGSCTVTMNSNVSVTATFSPMSTSANLTGTWSGQWMWTGPGSNGCTFNDGGAFSMMLTQSGTTFSGPLSAAGVQTRDANSNCAVVSTDTVTGTASITVSGTVLNLSFGLSGTSSFAGTATLNNNTLTATFQRNLNGTGPGSFTLTRQ